MYKTNNFYWKVYKKAFFKTSRKNFSAGAFLNESFSSIAVIKTFNLESVAKR